MSRESLSLMPLTSRCATPSKVPYRKVDVVTRQRDHPNYLAVSDFSIFSFSFSIDEMQELCNGYQKERSYERESKYYKRAFDSKVLQ